MGMDWKEREALARAEVRALAGAELEPMEPREPRAPQVKPNPTYMAWLAAQVVKNKARWGF